jgi:hypothetical protein
VRVVAIVTVLGIVSACASVGPNTSARRDLLADLGARLEKVRSARAQNLAEPLNLDPSNADFELLVGMSKEELLDSLGPPTWKAPCFEDCESDPAWAYSFYHFPAIGPGGGPELFLYFEGTNEVRRFLHAYTQ